MCVCVWCVCVVFVSGVITDPVFIVLARHSLFRSLYSLNWYADGMRISLASPYSGQQGLSEGTQRGRCRWCIYR